MEICKTPDQDPMHEKQVLYHFERNLRFTGNSSKHIQNSKANSPLIVKK